MGNGESHESDSKLTSTSYALREAPLTPVSNRPSGGGGGSGSGSKRESASAPPHTPSPAKRVKTIPPEAPPASASGSAAASAVAASVPVPEDVKPAVLEYCVKRVKTLSQDDNDDQLLFAMYGMGWMSLADIYKLWRVNIDEVLDAAQRDADAKQQLSDGFQCKMETVAGCMEILFTIPSILNAGVRSGKVERRGPGSEVPIKDEDTQTPSGSVAFSCAPQRPEDFEKQQYHLVSDEAVKETRAVLAKMRSDVKTSAEKAAELELQNKCVVCMEAARSICFTPCRHFCTCKECADKVTKCPLCRADIASYSRLYT